jgi:hypothetical protein
MEIQNISRLDELKASKRFETPPTRLFCIYLAIEVGYTLQLFAFYGA